MWFSVSPLVAVETTTIAAVIGADDRQRRGTVALVCVPLAAEDYVVGVARTAFATFDGDFTGSSTGRLGLDAGRSGALSRP